MSFSSRHCFEACHFLLAFSTLPLHDAKNVAGISSAVGKGMLEPLRLNCRDVESRLNKPPGVPGSPSVPTAEDNRLIRLGRLMIPSPSWLVSIGGSASGLLRLILILLAFLVRCFYRCCNEGRQGAKKMKEAGRRLGPTAGGGACVSWFVESIGN